MKSQRTLVGLSVLAAVLFGTSVVTDAAGAQRESFCGTVRYAPHSCVIVHPSMVGPPDFDISGAAPRPPTGALISGSGNVRRTSICDHTYRRLVNVTWRKVDVCALGSGGAPQ